MAIKMQQRRGTASQWTAANPILGAGEVGHETDTNTFKLGDGTLTWSALPYFKSMTEVNSAITSAVNVEVGNRNGAISTAISTEVTNRDNAITSAIGTEVTDRNSAIATAKSEAGTIASGYVSTHNSATTNVHGISDTSALVTSTQLALKAPLDGPTFTGTVVLPSTTSIGNVSATEIGYVDGVTSAIQNQLNDKLGTSTASSTYLALSGGTLTGALTLSGAPTSDLHAATKLYVDGLAAGINFHQPVVAATTGDLAGTYNNGTNGFGATLTKASNGSIGTIDGATVAVGNRILLRAQTDSTQNGIYNITAVGSGSAPWQITRAVDADNNPSGELATGDFCFVTGGSTNAAKGFILSTTGTITIGTTNITYSQFNASEAVTAGTNISKSGSTISVIDAPTFAGVVTASAAGVAFSDGTQTKQGVPSLTTINQQAGAYTTVLADRDKLVEVSSASGVTVTIPTNASVAYPVGTSIDILQTGVGQVTIAGASGVTVNSTPGLKLRTQWSSATLFKRATDTWVVYGDLSA